MMLKRRYSEGTTMLVSVRKKHWLMLSISATGVLLLLVFNVKPPMQQPSRAITGDAEIGFLRRRIANDDGELTGVGAPPPPPPEPHLDPPQQPDLSSPKKSTSSVSPQLPVHLSEEQRVAYAKQGILLVESQEKQKQVLQAKQEEEQQSHEQQLEVQPQPQPQQQQLPEYQPQQQQQQLPEYQPQQQLQQVQPQQPQLQEQKPQSKEAWQQQISLQRLELQKQQQLLQERHLYEQQQLQRRLQLQEQGMEIEAQQQQQQMVMPPSARHQSSSISVVSRTAQVSQETTNENTASGPSGFRNPMSFGPPMFSHMTYENLKSIGERILRHTIKREFLNSVRDTTFTPGEIINPSQVRRVIILSTWRSGSTFLGDLLRSYPGTYFSFEPLHHLLKNLHLQEGPLVEVVTNLIRSILICDLTNQDEYVNYMRNNTFLIDHNTRLWNSCARNRAICFDKEYISNMCKYMPVNVMKTVRMGLSPVVELLQDPSLDLRVIHLVRDPRGSLHSRMQLSWCKSKACSDPETVCEDLLTDLKLSTWVKERFPDRYMFVRYEDLGLNPEEKAKEIMEFLHLTFQKSVAAFVRDHTSLTKRAKKKTGTYSTYRDSKTTTFAWRGALNFTTVESIQEVCREPLQVLGFRYFQNEDEYYNNTISVLLNE